MTLLLCNFPSAWLSCSFYFLVGILQLSTQWIFGWVLLFISLIIFLLPPPRLFQGGTDHPFAVALNPSQFGKLLFYILLNQNFSPIFSFWIRRSPESHAFKFKKLTLSYFCEHCAYSCGANVSNEQFTTVILVLYCIVMQSLQRSSLQLTSNGNKKATSPFNAEKNMKSWLNSGHHQMILNFWDHSKLIIFVSLLPQDQNCPFHFWHFTSWAFNLWIESSWYVFKVQ